eukprot:CAMPEP_0178660974 /NCGR_PEP_ID=MMETSP0698-20121128/27447_1 /TAXON_ID=265572 /ORGANISM="Extubocellulus spinifer, Strain CCMP396" /LENGTH=41 /DNA_ID= /DNA_START= /DNA_END= /DNA_ORIENTATION=
MAGILVLVIVRKSRPAPSGRRREAADTHNDDLCGAKAKDDA